MQPILGQLWALQNLNEHGNIGKFWIENGFFNEHLLLNIQWLHEVSHMKTLKLNTSNDVSFETLRKTSYQA